MEGCKVLLVITGVDEEDDDDDDDDCTASTDGADNAVPVVVFAVDDVLADRIASGCCCIC